MYFLLNPMPEIWSSYKSFLLNKFDKKKKQYKSVTQVAMKIIEYMAPHLI